MISVWACLAWNDVCEASAHAPASTGQSSSKKQPAADSMPWLKSCDRCECVLQNHQIDQLKEEISGKDLALVKEHFDHMKVISLRIDSHAKHLHITFPDTCTYMEAHMNATSAYNMLSALSSAHAALTPHAPEIVFCTSNTANTDHAVSPCIMQLQAIRWPA